jgi:nicotinate-nucleotide adenylyltransferase
MAPFSLRLEGARALAAGHPRVRVSDIESRFASTYTADTLGALRRRFPRLRFVWLMGADNLAQLPRWRHWRRIFETVPIAVFDRPSHSLSALSSLPVRRFARYRLPTRAARRLAETKPPAWAFFHSRLDPTSATAIRSALGRAASHPAKEQRPDLTTITALRAAPHPAILPRLLDVVLQSLEDGKAEDIVTIELAGKTTIADQMVVASAHSARQVLALTERLEAALAPLAHIAIEGKTRADWVLIDAGDVIVHLFRPEIRAYYNLEKMWGEFLPDAEAAQN